MKRFVLFFNGKVLASFQSERAARFRFLKACSICDYRYDTITLVDLELDGKTIAEY